MANVGVFAAVFDDMNRILCVKINYGSHNWTLPGGHLEKNESPDEGAKREVYEETGYIIDIEKLISVYSTPAKDEVVFVFKGVIKEHTQWTPNDEIEKIGFFERNNLPKQIHSWNITRINDAYDNRVSSFRLFR